MTVIFFGTSDYCLPVLESLKTNFDLKLVVTRPDAPIGRKKIMTPSAVKIWAEKNNIPIITPATLKKDTSDRNELYKLLNSMNCDLAVVSDYGLIIPEKIFNLPKLGTYNIHFSKLPEFRGPSPVQATLLRGDTKAWITIFKLENPPELQIKMDSGPIIDQRSFFINPDDTTETLYTKLFQEVAKYLPEAIKNPTFTPQDQSRATFTKLLTRQDGFVSWENITKPETYNIFRSMTSWPGLWTTKDGKRLKILKCHQHGKTLVLDEVQFEGELPRPLPEQPSEHI